MSAGSFEVGGYETDAGAIRPIRVQPETLLGDDNPFATGARSGGFVRVSGGNRKIGLKARRIAIKRNLGPVVEGIQPTIERSIPILTPAVFDALEVGDEIAYLGVDWQITGKIGERGR